MIKKTTDVKNQALRSPFVMSVAGAILGAAAAKLIKNATALRTEERIEWYGDEGDYDGDGDGADIGVAHRTQMHAAHMRDKAAAMKDRVADKASEMKDRVADKAGEMKDRVVGAAADMKHAASERVDELREKLPSMESVREGANRIYRRATEEQPVIGALLALGAGMALGLLLPVSDVEERAIEPVKERAAENLGALEAKVRELSEKLDARIAGETGSGSQAMTETKPEQVEIQVEVKPLPGNRFPGT